MSISHTKFTGLAKTAIAKDASEIHGPRNAEDQRVHDLVTRGMNSGRPVPVDAAYFARLRARVQSKQPD